MLKPSLSSRHVCPKPFEDIQLLYHHSTSALNTEVKTKRGVVTLRGQAGSAAEKDLAAKYANDVKGVKSVNNRMTIE